MLCKKAVISFLRIYRDPPVYNIFKMCDSVLIFNLPRLTQRQFVKVTFSWNLRGSRKEAGLLLRSWSTLYIAFSKCKVPWFYSSCFNFSLLTESAYVKVICVSFMEHPVCSNSNFKMYTVQILVFFILIDYNWSKGYLQKSIFVEILVLRERSSDIALFVEHPVRRISKCIVSWY